MRIHRVGLLLLAGMVPVIVVAPALQASSTLAPALQASSSIDAAAVQRQVDGLAQKIAGIKDRSIASDLEGRLARFKETTNRMTRLAGPVDALTAREIFIKTDLQTKSAALKHLQEVKKQATSDLDRWLEAWGKDRDVHNANLPTFKLPEQQAAMNAFAAEANRSNAERDQKLADRKQILEKLDAENKPAVDAYWAVWNTRAAARLEKDNATQALFAESKTWQEQQTWLNAAVDVAGGGTNPADALMPFPSGSAAPTDAALAAGGANPAGTNVDAGAQLRSATQHSLTAATVGSKEEAGKGFDASGRESGSLIVAKPSAGHPVPAFVTNLPETARNDTQIQQSVAYYQKLDVLKAETAQKIEALKQEQTSGKGDAAVLAAHLGTLTNDLKRHENDQAQAKATVKKRVKDLGFDWNETSAKP